MNLSLRDSSMPFLIKGNTMDWEAREDERELLQTLSLK